METASSFFPSFSISAVNWMTVTVPRNPGSIFPETEMAAPSPGLSETSDGAARAGEFGSVFFARIRNVRGMLPELTSRAENSYSSPAMSDAGGFSTIRSVFATARTTTSYSIEPRMDGSRSDCTEYCIFARPSAALMGIWNDRRRAVEAWGGSTKDVMGITIDQPFGRMTSSRNRSCLFVRLVTSILMVCMRLGSDTIWTGETTRTSAPLP